MESKMVPPREKIISIVSQNYVSKFQKKKKIGKAFQNRHSLNDSSDTHNICEIHFRFIRPQAYGIIYNFTK